jgi:Cu/Ag efflux protein CusF
MLRIALVLVLIIGCGGEKKGGGGATAGSAPSGPAGSGSAEAPLSPDRVRTRGKIVAMSAEELEIHHERIEAIRGYDGTVKPMEAMTMPFGRNSTSFEGLAVGDLVEFVFTVHFDSEPTLRIVKITKLPADTKLAIP